MKTIIVISTRGFAAFRHDLVVDPANVRFVGLFSEHDEKNVTTAHRSCRGPRITRFGDALRFSIRDRDTKVIDVSRPDNVRITTMPLQVPPVSAICERVVGGRLR